MGSLASQILSKAKRSVAQSQRMSELMSRSSVSSSNGDMLRGCLRGGPSMIALSDESHPVPCGSVSVSFQPLSLLELVPVSSSRRPSLSRMRCSEGGREISNPVCLVVGVAYFVCCTLCLHLLEMQNEEHRLHPTEQSPGREGGRGETRGQHYNSLLTLKSLTPHPSPLTPSPLTPPTPHSLTCIEHSITVTATMASCSVTSLRLISRA